MPARSRSGTQQETFDTARWLQSARWLHWRQSSQSYWRTGNLFFLPCRDWMRMPDAFLSCMDSSLTAVIIFVAKGCNHSTAWSQNLPGCATQQRGEKRSHGRFHFAFIGALCTRAQGKHCDVGSRSVSDRCRSPTRASRTCAQALPRAQEFFTKFAAEIVQLQKQNLRDVVMRNQAKRYVEWVQAKNFFPSLSFADS